MKARFYTLLFAFLPKRLQKRLWNRLANTYGYHGIHGMDKFRNGTFLVVGTPKHQSDFYKDLLKDMPPGEIKELKCND